MLTDYRWVVIVAVNVGAVTVFGEIEVVASTIKFSWIFVVIISCIGKSAVQRARIDISFDNVQYLWLFPRGGSRWLTCSAVISAGGGPVDEGYPIGFRYWNSTPFTNGFKVESLLSCLLRTTLFPTNRKQVS